MNRGLQEHVRALRFYAEHLSIRKTDVDELEQSKKQLKDLRELIRRWQSMGDPVPESLKTQVAKWEAEIGRLAGCSEAGHVYEEVLAIVDLLGRRCRRQPQKDLLKLIREREKKTTPAESYRAAIVQILEESGGSAEMRNVRDRIEQRFRKRFTQADLDLLPGREYVRWEGNVYAQVRKMRQERVLLRRGGSTLILAGRGKETGRPGRHQSQRLQWTRASSRQDRFDLKLMNPEVLDVAHCKQILREVETRDGRNPPHFSTDADREFRRWLDDLDSPLREQAYARLSNWFLTHKDDCKSSPLAEAARELWNALFCAEPGDRLTSPEAGHKMLPEKFDRWWSKQSACQSR
ncbi:MAG: hypothetical protein M1376_08820 [Planctomycetes bacterium]|nr:hypothetical protein [Planctomycetota bacterium]